jgi:hypothetical protein
MAHKGLVAQPTRAAPAAPVKAPVIPPTLLPVCCICRKIRDHTGPSSDDEHWVTQRTYRKTYGLNPADFLLTHTYCLNCFRKFQTTLRQYYRENGTSP